MTPGAIWHKIRIFFFRPQLTRSISSSNNHHDPGGGGSHVPASGGGPGSPYRSSSGSLNGLSGLAGGPNLRPSLNKELMQKLRSMTETIKMLGEENAALKRGAPAVLDQETMDKKKGEGDQLTNPRRRSL